MQRESGALSWMHRRIALHIGQREIGFPVTAIGRAQEREQRGILTERQDLPVAKCPALGSEVKREDANFSNKWIHEEVLLIAISSCYKAQSRMCTLRAPAKSPAPLIFKHLLTAFYVGDGKIPNNEIIKSTHR